MSHDFFRPAGAFESVGEYAFRGLKPPAIVLCPFGTKLIDELFDPFRVGGCFGGLSSTGFGLWPYPRLFLLEARWAFGLLIFCFAPLGPCLCF